MGVPVRHHLLSVLKLDAARNCLDIEFLIQWALGRQYNRMLTTKRARKAWDIQLTHLRPALPETNASSAEERFPVYQRRLSDKLSRPSRLLPKAMGLVDATIYGM